MKKRIFAVLALLTTVLLLVTSLTAAFFYYQFYKEQAEEEVRKEASLMAVALDQVPDNATAAELYGARLGQETRVTLLTPEGTVLFDSNANPAAMENHLDREEIQSAMETGTGESIRYSSTLDRDTFYYALRLENGEILRLSRQLDKMLQVFSNTIPATLGILLLLLLSSLLLSSWLTKKIMRPIEKTSEQLGNLLTNQNFEIDTYDELEFFTDKIRELREQLGQYIEELKTERDTFSTITKNMEEGFILLDNSRQILSINRSAKRMLSVPEDREYLNQNILHLTRDTALQASVNAAYTEHARASFPQQQKDGRAVRYLISPIQDERGGGMGVMIFMSDITNEMKAELIRRDFAANVSHELKTPLTSISGFAEMIENGMIIQNSEVKGAASRIHREATRLISLVEDLMRLSQIENQTETDSFEEVSLREVAEEVKASLSAAAERQAVMVRLACDEVRLLSNRTMMYELFYNLTDNAIKYNRPDGTVDITVTAQGSEAVIRVTDTGIGIPRENQERIFERFYRVDKSRSKQTGGTGLGLSIVKHIAEYHGGACSVASEQGKGTVMTVRLPIRH